MITKSTDVDSLDWEEGVWVHRIVPVHVELPQPGPIEPHPIPQHIWNWSQSALATVKGINSRRSVSLVYTPLWDCEGIAFLLDGSFRLVTSLQTTRLHWLETYPDYRADREWMRILGDPIIEMERALMEGSWRIHAISRAIADDVCKLYGVDFANRIKVGPIGTRDWRLTDRSRPANNDAVHKLLFVGRLEMRKGIDVLLDVAPRLLARYPNWVLDIVGDDTIRFKESTHRALFARNPVDEDIQRRIRFHGKCDEARLRDFYRTCDILVAPSRYESFGLVLTEGMMFSKPVVASRTGGMIEVVSDGVTGILATAGNAASLEEALVTLLADPEKRQRMGQMGRARYEEQFTAAAMARRFSALFLESPDVDMEERQRMEQMGRARHEEQQQ